MNDIFLTGIGIVSPLGIGKVRTVESMVAKRPGFSAAEFFGNPRAKAKVVGIPPEIDVSSSDWRKWVIPPEYGLKKELIRTMSPHGVYAHIAVHEALRDAALTPDFIRLNESVSLHTASGGSPMLIHSNLAELHKTNGEYFRSTGVVSSIPGTLGFNLCANLGIIGGSYAYATACAASSHALGFAMDDLALGRTEIAIVAGADDANPDILLPFAAMGAMTASRDPLRASRPFDRERDGFVGSGGAVVLILESGSRLNPSRAKPYAKLLGWGGASDGFSVALPDPDGIGIGLSMRRALQASRIQRERIDLVLAHATSTVEGDPAEVKAIQGLWAGESGPPVMGLKGIAGHMLSASGVAEIALACLASRFSVPLSNPALENVDPLFQGINVAKEVTVGAGMTVLKNSSGFGGGCACHAFQLM